MSLQQKIDIRNLDWPLNILKCKQQLNTLERGDRIEILAKDRDVVKSLVALIRQSPGFHVKTEAGGKTIRLTIARGPKHSG